MIKNNIIVIVLVLVLAASFVCLQFTKLSISMNLEMEADTLIYFLHNCPLIIEADIEYDDSRTTIIGGNCILLPNHGDINLQSAVRTCDDSCSIVIGYPALPLESY